jgi:hypothetical protein
LSPTFVGYIGSTKDALLVIQAVLNNRLLAVPRRPHDKERNELIQSGSVFVFVEEKSGIKRWTDGVAWSPSRILGRFLVYRELDRSEGSGRGQEKQAGNNPSDKRGSKKMKKTKSFSEMSSSSGNVLGSNVSRGYSLDSGSAHSSHSSSTQHLLESASSNTVPDRSLVGSLIASYAFKESGLIKKTMSLTINKSDSPQDQTVLETVHLVSYYRAEDVLNGKLVRPVHSPQLKDIQLGNELWNAIKESTVGGKIPIEDEAFYFMDQSNPNAAALGFNPAIHLQPQYQKYNQRSQVQGQPGSLSFPQNPLLSNSVQRTEQQSPRLLNQPSISEPQFNLSFGGYQPISGQPLQHQPQTQQHFNQLQFVQAQNHQFQQPQNQGANYSTQHPLHNQAHHQGGSISLGANVSSQSVGDNEYVNEISGQGQYPYMKYSNGGFQNNIQGSISSNSSNPPAIKTDSPISSTKLKNESSPILPNVHNPAQHTNQYNLSSATPRNNLGPSSGNNHTSSVSLGGSFAFPTAGPYGLHHFPSSSGNVPGNTSFGGPYSSGSVNPVSAGTTNSLSTANGVNSSLYQTVGNGNSVVDVNYPNVAYHSAGSNAQNAAGANDLNSGKLFYDENGQLGSFIGAQYPHFAAGPPN